ncbi:unnamed protein product [Bursaphelenchus okinawaensis]|uniref:Uncharacterized protein n=1 Tax=Bursaphelenchus okinawaensis TaxID=465554 RepID=A0A811LAK0_9BILA|nr:unnamed protein product [Bursaphelenchus okinawaensis]CAG9120578.1 unnamed protein product [Bursaphelenchus okinawaensis]
MLLPSCINQILYIPLVIPIISVLLQCTHRKEKVKLVSQLSKAEANKRIHPPPKPVKEAESKKTYVAKKRHADDDTLKEIKSIRKDEDKSG